MYRTKAHEQIVTVVENFIDGLAQTITHNADGTVNYIEATDGVNTWRQTLTYTNGKVSAISAWVKQ